MPNVKNLFAILLLSAGLVVGCELLFWSLDTPDSKPIQYDAKTLVFGGAIVEAEFRCQQIVLTASLHTRGDHATDVVSKIQKNLYALPQQMQAQGFTLLSHHLKEMHVSAMRNGKGGHKGYAKSELVFEGFDSAEELLATLEQSGFSKIKNVRYRLLNQNEIIEQLSKQAYAKARLDARKTAAQKQLLIRRMNRYSYESNRESAYPDPVARIRLTMKASFWTNELRR